MIKSRLEALRALRELLSDEAHWTQGALARNASKSSVGTSSEKATCWCMGGALTKLYWNQYDCGGSPKAVMDANVYLNDFIRKQTGQNMSEFNDSHEHNEVLAIIDQSIEELLAQ